MGGGRDCSDAISDSDLRRSPQIGHYYNTPSCRRGLYHSARDGSDPRIGSYTYSYLEADTDFRRIPRISHVYYTRHIGGVRFQELSVSTVLEQDHFCSDFLVLYVTVWTNSLNPDDATMPPVAF